MNRQHWPASELRMEKDSTANLRSNTKGPIMRVTAGADQFSTTPGAAYTHFKVRERGEREPFWIECVSACHAK